MMRFKKLVVFASLASFLVGQSHAQAILAPVENFAINRAQAAIITRVAVSRGFAANDPRIAATLAGMGEVSTALNVVSTGAAIGLGFAGAPVWLTIAAGVGILAAGSALYAGGVAFSRSLDGKSISAQQPVPALPTYTGPLYQGSDPGAGAMRRPFDYGASIGMQVYKTNACLSSDSWCSGYPTIPTNGLNFVRDYGKLVLVAPTINMVQAHELYEQQYNCNAGGTGAPPMPSECSGVLGVSVWWQQNATGNAYTLMESRITTRLELDSFDNTWKPVTKTSTEPATWWVAGAGVAPIAGNDLATIYPQLTQASKNQPLDPNTLAQLTNQTWQRASQQAGYQGLPYSVTQPITLQDVQAWILANPDAVPNVSDLFRPATDAGHVTVVISPTVTPGNTSTTNPGTNPGSGVGTDVNVVNTPNVNVVNKISVDLGADPGVQAPNLEPIPPMSSILSPILGLFPDLKNWAMPSHASACPEPSFEVLSHTYTLNVHCELVEAHRTAIYTAFAAMFSLAALFIVLRA